MGRGGRNGVVGSAMTLAEYIVALDFYRALGETFLRLVHLY